MNILILSLSFYPDHSGIAVYSSDFAFYSAEQGHNVEVITGFGFYPHWKKNKEDRRKLFSTQVTKGVKILRGYIYVPQKPSTLNRIFQEISLLASASLNYIRAKKPDVIVVFTTPISLGFLGAIFKKISGCKLVINVQDFQLEAATSLKMTNQASVLKLLERIEKKSYQKADVVTSISNGMCNLLHNNKKLDSNKIYCWPNWINLKDYHIDYRRKGKFRARHQIEENKKIIAYAGNIGIKQGLETFVDLANANKLNNNFHFFLIGGGSGREAITTYASKFNLTNLSHLPLLNHDEYLNFLADLDVFFLPQKMTEFDIYFPSKLLGLMAANKILMVSVNQTSELYKTIYSYGIGLATEFGDINTINLLLNNVFEDKELSRNIHRRSTEYVQQFDRDYVLCQALEKITAIVINDSDFEKTKSAKPTPFSIITNTTNNT